MLSQHFLIFIRNVTAATYGNFFWKLSKKCLGKHFSSGISKQNKLSIPLEKQFDIWLFFHITCTLLSTIHFFHPGFVMDGLFLANRSSPLFCYGVCVMCMSLTISGSNVLLIYENALSLYRSFPLTGRFFATWW